MRREWLRSVDSTNTYIKEHRQDVEPMTMYCAVRQTGGRGQRGNSWESEPERNLTFSFLLNKLDIAPVEQFVLSEAVALAIVALLADYGIEAKVKWPNDIYVGNRKICGILIENSIMGPQITSSIVGAGLNVNQKVFLSDAPNPVSMFQLAGREFPLLEVAERLGIKFDVYLGRLGAKEELHKEYLRKLWRGDGRDYPFRDIASGEEFLGRISDVELTGHLIIAVGGLRRRYAFKEVGFI